MSVSQTIGGKMGHLATDHQLTVAGYLALHPSAPISSATRRASMIRWHKKKKNRRRIREYNKQWAAEHPDRVKAHKKRSAERYKPRRKMLYANRTPERIAEDNRKALEAYHRRYPNRTPEQVARDKDKSKANYEKQKQRLADADRIIAQLEQPKRKRGRRKGEILVDTQARILMTAYLFSKGWSKRATASVLYPSHSDKDEALRTANISIFNPHRGLIEQEQERLARLPEHVQLAEFETARAMISGPSGRVA